VSSETKLLGPESILLTQFPVLLRILDRGQKGIGYGVAVSAASSLSRVGGKKV
jgi:hypothetical protein